MSSIGDPENRPAGGKSQALSNEKVAASQGKRRRGRWISVLNARNLMFLVGKNATAAFVAALPGPRKKISLLPYHNVAAGKLAKLGRGYEPGPMAEPDEEGLARVISRFASHGLTATIGG